MTLEDLQKAIFAGDLDTIQSILDEDDEDLLSQRDTRTGSMAIHYATFVGRLDTIVYIIHMGAEVDVKNSRGETPLHIACSRKLVEVVDFFMGLDIDKFPLTLNNWTVLHCCAANNSIECAELLQFTSQEINSRNFCGETPLHVACASNNRFMVDWLLKKQADPEICDNLSRQPMHLACSVGSIDIIHLLHSRKAPLNTTDYKERTIFHYACRSASKQHHTIDVLKYLLQNTHVSPWSTDLDDAFPIYYALKCRKLKVAKFLVTLSQGRTNFAVFIVFCYASAVDSSSSFFNYLRKGISSEVGRMRDRFGYTPLHYAAEYDREDRVSCLISMKLDKNARAENGTTPLHCAVAAKSRYGAEVLLDNNADVNAERTDGITALHLACIFPNHEILTLLLSKDVDIYTSDKEGRTALMFLCNADNETDEVLSMLALLLAHRPTDADQAKLLEQTDRHGRTALHYACVKGNLTIVVELAKIGANVSAVDNYGKNGLHLAVRSLPKKGCQLRGFIQRDAFAKKNDLLANIITWAPSEINSEDAKKVTALHIACSSGNVTGVEMLLEAGADLKKMDANKLTASDWAAAAGQSAVLSLLLTKYKDRVLLSEFAIAKACEHGSLKCVQLLVEHFPEMAQCLAEHKSPLHLSAERGYGALCRYLIQNGALMDARDHKGYTPLMLAAKCPKGEDCVALLTEEAECPLVAQGPDGNSALHLACLHNNLNSAIHIYNALVLRKELPLVLAQKNNKEESLLHLSVKMTSKTMLTEFLKDMKGSIVDKDNRGRQPLYSMIEQPEVIENMRLLMMELIKLDREDADNSTANISTSTGGNRSQLQDVDKSY